MLADAFKIYIDDNGVPHLFTPNNEPILYVTKATVEFKADHLPIVKSEFVAEWINKERYESIIGRKMA